MPKLILEDRVEKLEDVEERGRPFYVEAKEGGGYVLADPAGLLKNNRDLKAEKIALAADKAAVDADIAKYKALGDVDMLTALKAKKAEIDQAQVTNNADLEKWKRDYAANKDGETQAEKLKREKLAKRYEQEKIDGAVVAALNSAGATADGMEYLKTLIGLEVKVFWEDDEPVIKVVDSKGAPKRNAELDPMTIEELVAGHKKKVGHFFRSGGGSGGGSSNADDISITEFDKKPSTWAAAKMKKYVAQFGHESYRKLVAEEANAPKQPAS